MKAELPDSKASRVGSSCAVDSDGSATLELESCPISASASSVGCSASSTSSGLARTEVPADSTIWFSHTTSPSYLLPWTWILLLAGGSASAISIISPQVSGGSLTRSERYQSSWVFDHRGAA